MNYVALHCLPSETHIAELEEHAVVLESKIAGEQERVKMMSVHVDAVEKENAQLREEKKELQAKVAHPRDCSRCEDIAWCWNVEVDRLNGELAEAQAQRSDISKQCATLKKANKRLREEFDNEVDSAKVEQKALCDELAAAEKREKKLQHEGKHFRNVLRRNIEVFQGHMAKIPGGADASGSQDVD